MSTREQALLLAAAAADAASKLEHQIASLRHGVANALEIAELERVLDMAQEMAAKLALLAAETSGGALEAGG
jgi:hypothetical protein